MRAVVFMLVLSSVLLAGVAGCASAPGPEGEAALDASSGSKARVASTTTVAAEDMQTTSTKLSAAGQEGAAGTAATGSTQTVKIGEPGERRNPIPLNQEALVGDWKITVVGAILDATQIVLEENMFNAAPDEGDRYVLVSIEATYVGGESSTFWLDTLCSFVGGKGDSYRTGAVVPPDSITDEGAALPGAGIAGNLVFEVASDQVPGGTLLLEEAFSFDKIRVFFAVE